MAKTETEITGMDVFLFSRYEQLKDIHERLENGIRSMKEKGRPVVQGLEWLLDDVRKMRDDAKAEYDEF